MTSALADFGRPAPLRGTDIVQVQRSPDESEMRKCLRKVSDLPLRLRIVLFREKTDIVAKRQQAFEQGARFRVAILQRIVVDEPKTAGQEDTLPWREAINVRRCSVAQNKAVDHELSLNRRDGTENAWIVRRQKAHDRYHQQARVELAAAEALGEGVAAAVEPVLANHRVHLITNVSPPLHRSLQIETLRITHRAIEGNPRHDLRVGEVAAPAPDFPNSVVRLLPNPFQMLDQLLLLRPGRRHGGEHVLS